MKQLFFAFFFCYGFLSAQVSEDFSVSFDHVALSVKNVDTSASFYKKALHLKEITNRTEQEGIRWFSLGNGKELHLISVVPGEIILNKAVHFALKMENFNLFVAHLQENGIPFTGWNNTVNEVTVRADGIQQVYIVDPDGYYIEVNSVE